MNDKSQKQEEQLITLTSSAHSPAGAALLLDRWSKHVNIGELTQDEVKNLVRIVDAMLDRAWSRVIKEGWAVDLPELDQDDEDLPF